MEFKKIPFIKLTLAFAVLAMGIYLCGFQKLNLIHNPEVIHEFKPNLNIVIILGCVSIITFISAIFQRIVIFKRSS